MLNAAVFIADPKMAALLRGMVDSSNEFVIESIVELTSSGYEVARILNTTTPDVMLLEMTDFDRDICLAAAIYDRCPDIPIVGLASHHLQLLLNRNPNSNLISFAAESDRIRTGFRGEAEHDSGMIPNSIPG